MKMKFTGKISYTIDTKHPDFEECNLKRGEVYTFTDTYIMDDDYFLSTEQIINHIKHDLRLVAGGGYDYDHIHRVVFDIKRVA